MASWPEAYEDAHGEKIEKEAPHDMLLPHEILASLYKSGRMQLLVGTGSAAFFVWVSHAWRFLVHRN